MAFPMRENQTIKVSSTSGNILSVHEYDVKDPNAPEGSSGSSEKMLSCEVRFNFSEGEFVSYLKDTTSWDFQDAVNYLVAYAEQPPEKVYLTQENSPLYNDEGQRAFRVLVPNYQMAIRHSEFLDQFIEALKNIPGSSGEEDSMFRPPNPLVIEPDHESMGQQVSTQICHLHFRRWPLVITNCFGLEKILLSGPPTLPIVLP